MILVLRAAFSESPDGDAEVHAYVLIDLAVFCGTLPQCLMALMPNCVANLTCGAPCHVSDLSKQFMY